MSTFYSELMRGLGASSRLWEIIERKPLISTQGEKFYCLTCQTFIVIQFSFGIVRVTIPNENCQNKTITQPSVKPNYNN